MWNFGEDSQRSNMGSQSDSVIGIHPYFNRTPDIWKLDNRDELWVKLAMIMMPIVNNIIMEWPEIKIIGEGVAGGL
jgi:hypothetical protein